MTNAELILTLERAALDRWGKGDPWGYIEILAPDVTYFDPLVDIRIDGREAMEEYFRPIIGKISVERYEILNPQVVVQGEIALLTFNLVDFSPGIPEPSRWNSTEVYQRLGAEWKIIHSHWSFTKPKL